MCDCEKPIDFKSVNRVRAIIIFYTPSWQAVRETGSLGYSIVVCMSEKKRSQVNFPEKRTFTGTRIHCYLENKIKQNKKETWSRFSQEQDEFRI